MNLSYDATSIARWAQFSGDFNPIHFDRERAREMGVDDVVVHGMLPQLFLQQGFTSHLHGIADRTAQESSAQWASKRWPTMKTMFRGPVVKDRIHVLDTIVDDLRARFALYAGYNEQTLCGILSVTERSFATSDGNDYGLPVEFVMDANALRTRLELFTRLFPEITALWVALSAVTFAEFLAADIPLCVVRNVIGLESNATQHDLMKASLTLQTAYTVAVDPKFSRLTIDGIDELTGVRCPLHAPTIATSKKTDISGLFPFDVMVGNTTVMQAEIGLMMRVASARN